MRHAVHGIETLRGASPRRSLTRTQARPSRADDDADLSLRLVVLRFEDGHEIRVPKGRVKTFDCYSGETIKVVAVFDPTSSERELLETLKADELPDAEPHEAR